MSQSPSLSPEPLSPQPLVRSLSRLPPSSRDFDIHRMSLTLNISTYRIADKHGISQTRVRQVIQHVSNWLAETLPVPLEAEQDRQTNLAKHLAADQMRRQIEQLQLLWDTTNEPKYSRQLTRVIASLARLGVIPGKLESLAADATIGPYDPTEPQAPWSEDDPWANSHRGAGILPAVPSPSPPLSPSPPDLSPTPPSSFSIHPSSFPPPPPSEDCSTSSQPSPTPRESHSAPHAPTPAPPTPSLFNRPTTADDLYGLNLMEKRLLIVLDSITDPEHRADLNESLAHIRRERAALEIRLSPNTPVTINNNPGSARASDPAETSDRKSPSHDQPDSLPGSTLVMSLVDRKYL